MAIFKKLRKQIDKFVTPAKEPEPTGQDCVLQQFRGEAEGEGIVGPPRPYIAKRSSTEDEIQEKIPPPIKIKEEKRPINVFDQSHYSEGATGLYSLEEVDIATVKPLRCRDGERKERGGEIDRSLPQDAGQCLFDFGKEYKDWMSSLRLYEPISVLRLSNQAYQRLLEHGFNNIKQVLNQDPSLWHTYKGMGQGHIDEIQAALKKHLGGEQIYCSKEIDLKCLVSSALGACDPKDAHCFLRDYDLHDIIALSTSELATEKHFSKEQIFKAKERALNFVRQGEVKDRMRKVFEELFLAFLTPWMRRRQGMSTSSELIERMVKVCSDGSSAKKAFHFFQDVYWNGNAPFNEYFITVERDVFCCDEGVAERYKRVLTIAKSFFYSLRTTYPLDELKEYLLRDLVKQWDDTDPDFIERVLRLSPCFMLRRFDDGILVFPRIRKKRSERDKIYRRGGG